MTKWNPISEGYPTQEGHYWVNFKDSSDDQAMLVLWNGHKFTLEGEGLEYDMCRIVFDHYSSFKIIAWAEPSESPVSSKLLQTRARLESISMARIRQDLYDREQYYKEINENANR